MDLLQGIVSYYYNSEAWQLLIIIVVVLIKEIEHIRKAKFNYFVFKLWFNFKE